MSTKTKFAHELVAKTAKELAGEFYEMVAHHSDDFYAFYPKQDAFIEREWKRFVEAARLSLSKLLGDSTMNEYQKEMIFDALIKHASMPGNTPRNVAQAVAGSVH